jgi:hypothetical protein
VGRRGGVGSRLKKWESREWRVENDGWRIFEGDGGEARMDGEERIK